MSRRAFVRASSSALALSALLSVPTSCSSDPPRRPAAAVGFSLVFDKGIDPKGLLDVDTVKLRVYDGAVVACEGASLPVPPETVERIAELSFARCDAAGKPAWCGTLTLEKNADRPLTFYVEGRYAARNDGFTGCATRAVDQDPLQLELKAQPIIQGVQCGDVIVGYGETCDPGVGVVDEACDGAKCQTKEVVLGNGKATENFYRGLPGRKTGLDIRFHDGKFYGLWADKATGGSGGDASGPELTIRRVSGDLISEATPTVLRTEVRLPDQSGAATTSGAPRRPERCSNPSFAPLPLQAWLAVFLCGGKVVASPQRTNLGVASAADVQVNATINASEPDAASSPTGEVLIAFVEANAVKSVLRKADGTFSGAQILSSGGTVSHPRIAWVGGDFVVVWGNGDDIKIRRVGADGTPKGAELRVNENRAAGVQSEPDVAGFETGEFLVAWKDAQGDVGADIRVQKFDKTGMPTGAEIAAVLDDTKKDGDQSAPAVAAGRSPAGTRFFLVAWQTTTQIAARYVKVDEPGFLLNHVNKTTSEFDVGVDARPRSSPAVAVGPTHVAIAWADEGPGDPGGDDDRVRVRRLPMPDPPK